MKVFSRTKNAFYAACSKIHLIDKCLIIIMFLLLLQSSFSLFSEEVSSSEINTIDIIVRTATASIFGYFLSSNFIRHASEETVEKSENKYNKQSKPEVTGQDVESLVPSESHAKREPYSNNRLQIIITTAIAIFCLIVLTVIRNTAGPGDGNFTASAQATISQFRDLVSGCIGFLIGVPTTKN